MTSGSQSHVHQTGRQLVRRYLTPFWPAIIAASACSLVLGLLSTLVVTAVGPAMMVLLETSDEHKIALSKLFGNQLAALLTDQWPGLSFLSGHLLLLYLPAVLVVVALLKALFQFSSWYLWEWLAEGAAAHLRRDLISTYLGLDPQKRSSVNEEELSSTVTTDCKLLREYLVHFYGGFPREALQMGFMIVTQLLLSTKLCLIFLLGVLPIALLVTRLGKKLKKRSSKALANYSFLSEWLQQRLLGLATIKHYQTENRESHNMAKRSWALYDKLLGAARVKARTAPLVEFLALTCMVIVLGLALIEINQGTLSGAVALSFFSSLALLAQSGASCGRYFNSNREGAAAVERICQTFARLEDQQRVLSSTSRCSTETIATVRVEDIVVSYRPPLLALDHFTFAFSPCTIYCLVGPSGSGKTTLLRVLLGLLTPDKGTVAFATNHQGAKLRVGYVPQKITLGRMSLGNQITYPDAKIDATRAYDALKQVGLADFVGALPQKLETIVGDDGRTLSGGQAQRLLLARLFYHRFDLILIDEGTSALDPASERLFYEAIKSLAKSATIIMIAHRPMAAEYADHCIRLKHGRVDVDHES